MCTMIIVKSKLTCAAQYLFENGLVWCVLNKFYQLFIQLCFDGDLACHFMQRKTNYLYIVGNIIKQRYCWF